MIFYATNRHENNVDMILFICLKYKIMFYYCVNVKIGVTKLQILVFFILENIDNNFYFLMTMRRGNILT